MSQIPERSQTAPGEGAATLGQAADFLNVSIKTVRRLIVRGELRSLKLGKCRRVQWGDLRELLASKAGGPPKAG